MAYRIGNDEKDRRQLAPDSKPSVKKYRTRFSPKQKLELENAFYRTPYPSATLRAQLANSLGVTPSVVMVRKLLFGMYMTRSRLSNLFFFHTLFDALRPRDSKLGWDIYGRNMGENIKRHNAGKTLGGFTLTKALTNVF